MTPKESFFRTIERALILCAHTDDEFGCAATIVRLLETGADVRYLALSRCEESVPPHHPKDILEHECRKSLQILGVPRENVEVLGLPVRHFPAERQPILERFFKMNQEYRPQLVFVPTSKDHHQDHATVYAEGLRAFRQTTILGYELPQNVTAFDNELFVVVSEDHIVKKIEALGSYQSQKFRGHSSSEYIRGLARVRGVQCGATFAEAFEAIRVIVR
jgi:LmbE family N-acetylglucosaminyl deacetylase